LVVFRVRDLILINLNREEFEQGFLCARYIKAEFIPQGKLSKVFIKGTDELMLYKERISLPRGGRFRPQ
jgi:hypothetical protein